MGEEQKSEKKPATKGQKIFSGIVTGVCILILLFAATLVILTAVAKKNHRPVSVFGYSFSIVQTDSMTPEIKVGELLTVKKSDITRVKVGDDAVFLNENGLYIVHRVIHTGSDEKGAYIVTQGVKPGSPTDEAVYSEQFFGIAIRHSVGWGKVMGFLSTPVNWIIILVVVAGIPAIIYFSKKVFVLSREAKKEKIDEREKMKEELLKEYSEAPKESIEESSEDTKKE